MLTALSLTVLLVFVYWTVTGALLLLWPQRRQAAVQRKRLKKLQRRRERNHAEQGDCAPQESHSEPGAAEREGATGTPSALRIRVAGLVWFAIGAFGCWSMGPSFGWLPAPGPPLDQETALQSLVRNEVEPFFRDYSLVGLVVAAVADDQDVILGFGRSDLDEVAAPDANTVFEIGSISKVFTGILLAEQVEGGAFQIDQLVQDVLPDGLQLPENARDKVTLRHLTTHTSGFPRMPRRLISPRRLAMMIFNQDPHRGYGEDEFRADVADVSLESEPGAKAEYSNFAVALLSYLLVDHLGDDYEEVLLQHICLPLGMNDTFVRVPKRDADRLAVGYRANIRIGDLILALESPNWDFPSHLAGAGGIRSTAHDMHLFLKANMGMIDTPLAVSIERSHQELFQNDESTGFGMNWIHLHRPDMDQPVLWHNGGTGGYRSFLAFTADGRFGVVVLSNTSASVDSLGRAILKRLAEDDWSD